MYHWLPDAFLFILNLLQVNGLIACLATYQDFFYHGCIRSNVRFMANINLGIHLNFVLMVQISSVKIGCTLVLNFETNGS